MPSKWIAFGLLASIALALPAPTIAQSSAPAAPQSNHGIWIGPHNNVKVETGDCGGNLCGWIVWAAPDAEQDAREGGVAKLVGTELLQNFRRTGDSKWEGRVFVPDMGRTFYSTITRLDPASLKISGCILGGLICKSQIWHRV